MLDVAQGGFYRFVPGVAHQIDQGGLAVAGVGEQAAAERVAGKARRVETGGRRRLLDQPGDHLVGHLTAGERARGGEPAEQRQG